MSARLQVTLLAGGVGGAKMAEGLAALPDIDLSIIGNVADDEEFHGLWVSPDVDTVTYSLADRIDRSQGWGVADEGLRALETLATLGAETWMTLGDRDFGLHIYRTDRRRRGDRPSDIAADVARAFGVGPRVLLPTDDRVQTQVRTTEGWLSFQQYFVREKCAPEVLEIRFDGIEAARPTPESLAALAAADLIVLAPSNPLVSLGPILATPGLRAALAAAPALKLAVSPLIAGEVVKGPAGRMMASLGLRADALGVAELYHDLLDLFVLDRADAGLMAEIAALGMEPVATDTLMQDHPGKVRLAGELVMRAGERRAQRGAA
ncbi:MAG: 2-phospho-L-lactate transferase [Pseudomonadota bacterium]